MIVAHRVARQETGVAQRREPLLPVAFLRHVDVHDVPVIHRLAYGVLVVAQDLLRFFRRARVSKREKKEKETGDNLS